MSESSAESELYALMAAYKSGRSFRLLVQEALADDILFNLRCINQPTIAMLENPSLSIYGEAFRQEIKEENAILTYINTNDQLADILTKPTSATVSDRLLPTMWFDSQKWVDKSQRDRPSSASMQILDRRELSQSERQLWRSVSAI